MREWRYMFTILHLGTSFTRPLLYPGYESPVKVKVKLYMGLPMTVATRFKV
jgi:hypothetical protein